MLVSQVCGGDGEFYFPVSLFLIYALKGLLLKGEPSSHQVFSVNIWFPDLGESLSVSTAIEDKKMPKSEGK